MGLATRQIFGTLEDERLTLFTAFCMVISWLGDAGIRIQTNDSVLVIDPPSGRGNAAAKADIVCLSEGKVSAGDDAFVIDQAGEFERKNVFVYGLHMTSESDRVHFRIEAEDLSLGHLGSLDHKLDNGELAKLEGVDILFIPVGGKSVLNAEQATAMISQIEPRIVIPIQHGGEYGAVAPFLKEIGAKSSEVQSKVKLSKKDLPADETTIMVLSND